MPGAGSFSAGAGPAGHDPVAAPSAPRRVSPPAALRFDGAARDYLLDGNGLYIAGHPVDQKVALALLVDQGTLAGAPEIGSRLRRIKRVSRAVAETTARDYVRLALATLVAAGDIAVLRVDVDTSQRGALFVAVEYQNLRDISSATPRTSTVTL